MVTPTSQKAGERPIGFLLSDGSGNSTSLNLVIRPEDLTRAEPPRQAVTQTFGGAWVDNFGPGISTVNISGHTGWRGGQNADGAANFARLRDTVFTRWHDLRAAAVRDGTNPDDVRLVFSDALDNFAVTVAPGQFILKRSRARPLLMMYQFSMTVLSEDVAPTTAESDDLGDTFPAGIDSLQDSLRRASNFAANIRNFISADIVGPAQGMMNVANTAMSRVLSSVGTVDRLIVGQSAQLVGFAQDITQTARNAFYTYNAIANQADFARMAVSEVAASFDNAFCVLSNIFRVTKLFPDYSDVYGASNCSSTAGGSPLSPLRLGSALSEIVPQTVSAVSVSPAARSSMNAFLSADPILAPMGSADLSRNMLSIGSGVLFQ